MKGPTIVIFVPWSFALVLFLCTPCAEGFLHVEVYVNQWFSSACEVVEPQVRYNCTSDHIQFLLPFGLIPDAYEFNLSDDDMVFDYTVAPPVEFLGDITLRADGKTVSIRCASKDSDFISIPKRHGLVIKGEGNGSINISNCRTAISVQAGAGPSQITLENVALHEHSSKAIYVQSPASVTLRGVTFQNNFQAFAWEPLEPPLKETRQPPVGASVQMEECLVVGNEGSTTPGVTIRASPPFSSTVSSLAGVAFRNNKRISYSPEEKEKEGAVALHVEGLANFEMSDSSIELNECGYESESAESSEESLSGGSGLEENKCHVPTVVFEKIGNVELQSCNITGNKGGGLSVVRTGSVYLRWCTFAQNVAADNADGGALEVRNLLQLDINDSTFEQNVATSRGGAMYLSAVPPPLNNERRNDEAKRTNEIELPPPTVHLRRTTISENNLVGFRSLHGGGLFFEGTIGTQLIFENVTIERNGAVNPGTRISGGGVAVRRAATVVFLGNSEVKDNARENVFDGAGIHMEDVQYFEPPTIRFNGNNKHGGRGGGVCLLGSPNPAYTTFEMTCGNSTILSFNEAESGSGFFVNAPVTITVQNCLFHKNIAQKEGALRATSVRLEVKHGEFVGNSGNTGSALWTDSDQVYIENCLFRDNIAEAGSVFIAHRPPNNEELPRAKEREAEEEGFEEEETGSLTRIEVEKSVYLADVDFLNNKAKVAAGLWVESGNINAAWSGLLFVNNEAEVAAGGAWLSWRSGTLSLSSSTFKSNRARQGLAGALAWSGDMARLTINEESIFEDNFAWVGGAFGVIPFPEELKEIFPSFIQARLTQFSNDAIFDVLEPLEEPDVVIVDTTFSANRADKDTCSQDVACFVPITIQMQPREEAPPFTNKNQRCGRVESLSPRCKVVSSNQQTEVEENLCSTACKAQLGGDPTLPPLCAVVRCPSGACADSLAQCTKLPACGPTSDPCKKEGKCFACSSGMCVRFSFECGIGSTCKLDTPETPVTCPDGACASHVKFCKPVPPCPITRSKRCYGRCLNPAENCTIPDVMCPPGLKLCNTDGMCRFPLECEAVPLQGCPHFQCPTGKCTQSPLECNTAATRCSVGHVPCPGNGLCVPFDQLSTCYRPAALRIPESFSLTVRGGEQPTTKFVVTVPESGATNAGDSAFDALLSVEIPPEVLADFAEDEEFSINAKSFDDVLQYLFPGEKDYSGDGDSSSDLGSSGDASDEGRGEERISARVAKVFSSLVELSFRKVTTFEDDILLIFTVVLPDGVSLDDVCLAFINEDAGRWECNPDPLELYAYAPSDSSGDEANRTLGEGDGFTELMVIGRTNHFSDFAVLLNEGADTDGEGNDSGGDSELVTILAAALVPSAFIIVVVVIAVGYFIIWKRNKAYNKQARSRGSTKVNFGEEEGMEMSPASEI
ncbi:hypothetical protein QOT17_021359 [Balamuthia mandrillaris]